MRLLATYRVTFVISREENIIPQQQPFKRKEDSHKAQQNLINTPVEQNDFTDFSSSTMLPNTLYVSFET